MNNEERISQTPILPFTVERTAADLQEIRDKQRPVEIELQAAEPTALAKSWELLKLAGIVLPYLFQLTAGLVMGNWKTTVTAVVAAVFAILSHYGIVLPESLQFPIVALGLAIVGMFAGDAKKTEQPK